jgi:serine/threonine protein kinase
LGTFRYRAPEQARGGPLTAAADVWGIGITLYEVASGDTPFDPRRTAESTADGDHHRCPRPGVSAPPVGARRRLPRALAAAIDGCLDMDPSARPTVTELAASLGTILPAYGPRMPSSGNPGAWDVATFPRPT